MMLVRKKLVILSLFSLVTASSVAADGTTFLNKLAPISEGSFKVGVFYDNIDHATLTLGLDQERIFGTDDHFRLNLSHSAYSTALEISTTDADIFESQWSRTLSFTSTQQSPNSNALRDYRFGSAAGQVAFSRDLGTYDKITVAAGFGLLDFRRSGDLPLAIVSSPSFKNDQVKSGYAAVTMRHSTLRGETFPTIGTEFTSTIEAGQSGQVPYMVTRISAQRYQPFTDRFFARARVAISTGLTSKGSTFPFNKNTFVGGADSVRGYKPNSLGPLSPIQNSGTPAAVGGQFAVTSSMELGYIIGQEKKLAVFGFVDAGNAANDPNNLTLNGLEKSRGVGVRWQSPIGTLDLSYAKPITPSNPDLEENWQITFGHVF